MRWSVAQGKRSDAKTRRRGAGRAFVHQTPPSLPRSKDRSGWLGLGE